MQIQYFLIKYYFLLSYNNKSFQYSMGDYVCKIHNKINNFTLPLLNIQKFLFIRMSTSSILLFYCLFILQTFLKCVSLSDWLIK